MDWPTSPSRPSYVYRAKLNRVIDGDTAVLDIDLGFHVKASISVRVHGANTPERGADGAAEATEWSAKWLGRRTRNAGPEFNLLVRTYRDRQSFARWVADVWALDQDAGWAEQLVESGHAVVMDH